MALLELVLHNSKLIIIKFKKQQEVSKNGPEKKGGAYAYPEMCIKLSEYTFFEVHNHRKQLKAIKTLIKLFMSDLSHYMSVCISSD